ncbi:hypothetical protein GCM10010425_68350 [Streptomyces spororaveus]|uniref:Uncharacterized protein n=1 Tax=Streptomyces spororaveus TaxID=284039 RepID=A0ABQ3T346_9ACTN|nr:hypothetical protein Sspor_03740 [Streptomyces spororaveus]
MLLPLVARPTLKWTMDSAGWGEPAPVPLRRCAHFGQRDGIAAGVPADDHAEPVPPAGERRFLLTVVGPRKDEGNSPTGIVGRCLARQLLAMGRPVRVLAAAALGRDIWVSETIGSFR